MDDHLDELVRRIQAGDAAAEDRLCRRVHPQLLRRASAILPDEGMEGPEDAVAETLRKFITFLRRSPAFRANVLAYLNGILKNAVLDIIDRRIKDTGRKENFAENEKSRIGGEIPGLPLPPEEIRRAVLELGHPCTRLLLHIYFHGVPTKILAALYLGTPVSLQAIYKRRDICLKALARRLNLDRNQRL